MAKEYVHKEVDFCAYIDEKKDSQGRDGEVHGLARDESHRASAHGGRLRDVWRGSCLVCGTADRLCRVIDEDTKPSTLAPHSRTQL